MALMQITIIPVGTKTPSVGDYVAGIQELLTDKGADFVLNDMGTVIHGRADELLRLAAEIHAHSFAKGVQRVVTQIILDERRDLDPGIGDKTRSVLDRIGKKED